MVVNRKGRPSMNTARLHRLEARLPAGSNGGICLFCLAVMGPILLIAIALRILG
jgi:hypothetical protein